MKARIGDVEIEGTPEEVSFALNAILGNEEQEEETEAKIVEPQPMVQKTAVKKKSTYKKSKRKKKRIRRRKCAAHAKHNETWSIAEKARLIRYIEQGKLQGKYSRYDNKKLKTIAREFGRTPAGVVGAAQRFYYSIL